MKKSRKIFLRILPVMLVAVIMLMSGGVYAAVNGGISAEFPTGNGSGGTYTTGIINNIGSVLKTALQVAAIVAIIFAGVRYMFASADAKADIKQQTVILVVGALIAFAAPTVVDLVKKIFEDIVR